MWLFCPQQAMVPPPPVLSVPPQAFDAYRQRMRAHFGIPTALDTSRCVACHAPSTISEAGRRKHFKTGLCEACWDLLAIADTPSRLAATQRCSRLAGFSACSYIHDYLDCSQPCCAGTSFDLRGTVGPAYNFCGDRPRTATKCVGSGARSGTGLTLSFFGTCLPFSTCVFSDLCPLFRCIRQHACVLYVFSDYN